MFFSGPSKKYLKDLIASWVTQSSLHTKSEKKREKQMRKKKNNKILNVKRESPELNIQVERGIMGQSDDLSRREGW